MAKPFAWSWSVLEGYETCPKRHYHLKVAKDVTEKQSDAMAWGNRVHNALDKRLKRTEALPETMADYEPLVASIERVGGTIDSEQKMALNADFQPTGYFAGDTWCRIITDFTVVKGVNAFVGDWKTGQPKPASGQLDLCAVGTFAHKPHLEKVITSFVWLQHGNTTNKVIRKSDVPAIWAEFMPRVRRLEHATDSGNFPARPSGLCRSWCPVPRWLCEHSGKS